jgi:hypothetical protein
VPLVGPNWERVKDGALAEGGRGLLFVELVADEWGVLAFRRETNLVPAEHQRLVFSLSLPVPQQDFDRVRLESGRYALAVAGPWES